MRAIALLSFTWKQQKATTLPWETHGRPNYNKHVELRFEVVDVAGDHPNKLRAYQWKAFRYFLFMNHQWQQADPHGRQDPPS